MGVGVAAYAFLAGRKPEGVGYERMGPAAPYVSIALFVLSCWMLVRWTRSWRPRSQLLIVSPCEEIHATGQLI